MSAILCRHFLSRSFSSCSFVAFPGRLVASPRLFPTLAATCFRRFSARTRTPRAGPQSSSGSVEKSKAAQESDTFYLVRKGNLVAVYDSLSDCQAQVSTSVTDPPVSVYRGHLLHQETKEYLASRGVRDALFTINVADAKEGLFEDLVLCPFKLPDITTSTVDQSHEKQTSINSTADMAKMTCMIEFDGCSMGNPGKAGAGVILKKLDGTLIARIREGLGTATCNFAEYRALILGLECARERGFTVVHVQGDSQLIVNQVQGLCKVRTQTLIDLYQKARKLKESFSTFEIKHVKRKLNEEADRQSELAAELPDGVIQEERF